MVKVNPDNTEEYYMDGYLETNLSSIKPQIQKDWDFVIIIDGIERGGKSVLAMQVAKFLYPKFALDDIAFNPSEFEKKVKAAKKYTCVVFDEAFSGMAAENYASMINRSLKRMMIEIGQKNLFIILVIPSFFELQKYHAVHRSIALLHIYTGDKLMRGFFEFYSKSKKSKLYFKGKREYSYKAAVASFRGRFTNTYVLDEAEYRKRKYKSMMSSRPQDQIKAHQMQRDALIIALRHEMGCSVKDITAMLKKYSPIPIHYRMIQVILKYYEDAGEKKE